MVWRWPDSYLHNTFITLAEYCWEECQDPKYSPKNADQIPKAALDEVDIDLTLLGNGRYDGNDVGF